MAFKTEQDLINNMTIDNIQEELSLALQGDLENGVAWLNREANAKFVKDYPSLNDAIGKILSIEVDDE